MPAKASRAISGTGSQSLRSFVSIQAPSTDLCSTLASFTSSWTIDVNRQLKFRDFGMHEYGVWKFYFFLKNTFFSKQYRGQMVLFVMLLWSSRGSQNLYTVLHQSHNKHYDAHEN
jgi:hypothetical protein